MTDTGKGLNNEYARRPSDLEGLLARVEGATGADRYVDCWLACAFDDFFPVPKQWPRGFRELGMTWRVDFCRRRDGGLETPGNGGDQMVPAYTASLDAALALVERVLPWGHFVVGTMPEGGGYYAALGPGDSPAHTGATPALALLCALLKALSAQSASPAERNDRAQDEQSNGKVE